MFWGISEQSKSPSSKSHANCVHKCSGLLFVIKTKHPFLSLGRTSPRGVLYCRSLWHLSVWLPNKRLYSILWPVFYVIYSYVFSEWRSIRPVEINQCNITIATHYDITMGKNVARDAAYCEITMGNGVATDIHCDVTMSNDITMCTHHDMAMNLLLCILCSLPNYVYFIMLHLSANFCPWNLRIINDC